MRVLIVNPSSPPIPGKDGLQVHNWGNIRILQMLGHEVYLVMLIKQGENGKIKVKEATEAIPGLKMCVCVEIKEHAAQSLSSLTPMLILKELIKPWLRKVALFVPDHEHVCLAIEKLIQDVNVELVWYEDFYVAVFDNWIRRSIPAVYNSHDNQANIYKQNNLLLNRELKRFGNKIRKAIYQNRHKALVKAEFTTQKRCDLMFTGNRVDAELSKAHGINAVNRRVPVIGPDKAILKARRKFITNFNIKSDTVKLMHLGSFNGSFTPISLMWFLDEVWPSFLKEFNNYKIELHIIGAAEPPADLLRRFDQPKVIYRGFVEDLWKEFINTFVLLIPGKISTGIRIRVPTAFSIMVPVIGNEISFRGMTDVVDGATALFAETDVDYTNAMKKFINSNIFYKSMCEELRETYNSNFSLESASEDIRKAIKTLI